MRHGLILLGLLAAAGCNPYQNLGGDFYLGPVDATNFQSAYLGAGYTAPGGNGQASVGKFSPSFGATVGGNPISYYAFPATPNAPIIDSADGSSTPLVYLFDGNSAADTSKCKPPSKTYSYDPRRDFVRFDRQGNVFEDQTTAPPLPVDDVVGTDSTSYTPVYQEVPVTSMGEGCNTIHSAEGLAHDANHTVTVQLGDQPVDDPTAHRVGIPNGKYLAIAMVDPRAIVDLPQGGGIDPNTGMTSPIVSIGVDNATGLGETRWGFYNHYLAGYIEGGEIPVGLGTMPDPNGGPDIQFIEAQTATILAPNTTIDPASGMPLPCDTADPVNPAGPCVGLGNDLFLGYDKLSGARTDPGYSPICKILTFTPDDPTNLPTDPTQVDKTSIDPDSGTYIYCLQVSQ